MEELERLTASAQRRRHALTLTLTLITASAQRRRHALTLTLTLITASAQRRRHAPRTCHQCGMETWARPAPEATPLSLAGSSSNVSRVSMEGTCVGRSVQG